MWYLVFAAGVKLCIQINVEIHRLHIRNEMCLNPVRTTYIFWGIERLNGILHNNVEFIIQNNSIVLQSNEFYNIFSELSFHVYNIDVGVT